MEDERYSGKGETPRAGARTATGIHFYDVLSVTRSKYQGHGRRPRRRRWWRRRWRRWRRRRVERRGWWRRRHRSTARTRTRPKERHQPRTPEERDRCGWTASRNEARVGDPVAVTGRGQVAWPQRLQQLGAAAPPVGVEDDVFAHLKDC